MSQRALSYPVPRPFLKWVGGKGQLLPELLRLVDSAGPFGRYHEPFVGGGALFFDLARRGRLGRKQAYLSDNNPNLIEAYLGVRNCVNDVIALLHAHKARHSEDYYYAVRAEAPTELPARAARVIYLNKTGFNGLYRENSKGQFNVPFGRYKNPVICDERNLRAVSEVLKRAKIDVRAFDTVLAAAQPRDLVYFDPPYVPISATSYFTSYDKNGFGVDAQRRLADVYAALSGKGVRAILSNSAAPLVRELYANYTIDEVMAARNVNSKGDRRGKIAEAMVRNF